MRSVLLKLMMLLGCLSTISRGDDDFNSLDSCVAILRHYSTMNAIDLKFNYIEYAFFQITTDERLNFMNTISLKHQENPDTFALVRLARIQEEMDLPPGYPSCIQDLMANRPNDLWNAMTESEQELLLNEIEAALDNIPVD